MKWCSLSANQMMFKPLWQRLNERSLHLWVPNHPEVPCWSDIGGNNLPPPEGVRLDGQTASQNGEQAFYDLGCEQWVPLTEALN